MVKTLSDSLTDVIILDLDLHCRKPSNFFWHDLTFCSTHIFMHDWQRKVIPTSRDCTIFQQENQNGNRNLGLELIRFQTSVIKGENQGNVFPVPLPSLSSGGLLQCWTFYFGSSISRLATAVLECTVNHISSLAGCENFP